MLTFVRKILMLTLAETQLDVIEDALLAEVGGGTNGNAF